MTGEDVLQNAVSEKQYEGIFAVFGAVYR